MTIVTNPARRNSDDDTDSSPNENIAPIIVSNVSSRTITPEGTILPSHCTRLYNDEQHSDVVFVAGINGDTWRYPGHRRVLTATSPVFAALLNCKTDIIVVDYIDRRGFEQLLRYHYCEPTQLNSVATARCTLDAAYKFLCPQLAEKCARRLDEMLNAGVALETLRDLRFLCARIPGAASAPPLTALHDDMSARYLGMCSHWCDALAHNALLVLDDSADEALVDERLEDLTYEDLSLIVKRDTFRVSNELILVDALSRWATATCKKYKREITPINRRAALGELAYCPRYLLLQGEDLKNALAMELLEPVERALVIGRSRKSAAPIPVGAEQEGLLRRWARPRPAEPAALPVYLSPRSKPPPEEPPSGLCVRRSKRPKPPAFIEKPKKEGCCSCSCFGDGLLRALICLFD